MKNLGDYHDLYQETDVVMLCKDSAHGSEVSRRVLGGSVLAMY